MTRRLSVKAARAVLDAAELVKASDWSESRCWLVMSGGRQLAVIEPAWQTGRRNGWRWRLAHSTAWNSRTEPTCEKAAVAALGAWQRWTTNIEK